MKPESQDDIQDTRSDDAQKPAIDATSEIPTHDAEFTRLSQERGELEQKLQRALADLANVRRRQRQEIEESRQRVIEGLTQELLPVVDTFSMALQAYDAQSGDDGTADPKALVEGVRMVRTMLSSVLERHGLQEIRATGAFNPNHHQALAVEPSDDVPEGHIVRSLLTGYLIGDRVVRHSRVVVSGTPAAEGDKTGKD